MSKYPHFDRSRPFGMPETPFDPETGMYLHMGDAGWLVEFKIVEIGHDVLLCVDPRDENEDYVLIAKAWPFRKSSFDGLEIGEEDDPTTYTSTDRDARTSTNTADGFNAETVTPAYLVGERVLATKMPDTVSVTVADNELTYVNEGDYDVDYESVNIAGRRWEASPRLRAILKTNRTDGNLLDCAILDKDGVELGTVVVARPPELQTAYYDGLTIDSVAYVFVDETSRTGDGATEEIVPSYVVDSTIVLLAKIPGGTGRTDPNASDRVVTWQEITFRGWGVS